MYHNMPIRVLVERCAVIHKRIHKHDDYNIITPSRTDII
jgi:hypothetical protein